MTSQIVTHHRYLSSELYSISDRHYFGFNGVLFIVPKEVLGKILVEIKDMNPLQCFDYLAEQANQRFKKVSI